MHTQDAVSAISFYVTYRLMLLVQQSGIGFPVGS